MTSPMIVCHHAVYDGTCDCEEKQLTSQVIAPEPTTVVIPSQSAAPLTPPQPAAPVAPPQPAAVVIPTKPSVVAVIAVANSESADLEVIQEADEYDDDDSYDSSDEYGLDCYTPSYDNDPDV